MCRLEYLEMLSDSECYHVQTGMFGDAILLAAPESCKGGHSTLSTLCSSLLSLSDRSGGPYISSWYVCVHLLSVLQFVKCITLYGMYVYVLSVLQLVKCISLHGMYVSFPVCPTVCQMYNSSQYVCVKSCLSYS